MKITESLSAFFISILLISFATSVSGFLPRGGSVPLVSFASVNQRKDIQRSNSQSSHSPDYFGLLTYGNFLTNYNFTTIWFNHSDRTGTGFTENQCIKSSTNDDKPTSIYCSLVSAATTLYGNWSQKVHLYLNESMHLRFDSPNSTIFFSSVPTKIEAVNNSKTELNKTCTTDVVYEFVNIQTNKAYDHGYDRTVDLAVKVSISKGDCEFEYQTRSLSANTKGSTLSEVYPYILFMAGIAIVQSMACGVLVRNIDKNHAVAKRTSLGTLCFFITFDFYIYLLHFSYWTSVSNWMAVVFILFFILSVFFEPALLYFAFNTLQSRSNTSIMSLLYQLYFWLLICGGSLIISQTWIPNFLFYAFPFFLVPQIADNFLSGNKYKWNHCLLLGLGLPKLGYLAYLFLNLAKMFKANFASNTIIYCVGVLLLQLAILKVQTKWPTFGMKIFRANDYSYLCNKTEICSLSGVVCSICTEQVRQTPLIGNQQPLMEQNEDNEDIMKTPCQHYYHSTCLKEWFKKKFECPNCREKLPMLVTDDD